MDAHAITVLELASVIQELGTYSFCDSTPRSLNQDFIDSQDGFRSLAPKLEQFKAACATFRSGLIKTGEFIGDHVEGSALPFEILQKEGAVLELEEVAAFARFVHSAMSIHSLLATIVRGSDQTQGMPAVLQLIESFPQLKFLENKLSQSIDESGQLREENIPELRNARSRIANAQTELRKTAHQIVMDKAAFTSGEFATIRDGRMVIPLKADFKGRVPGIVHRSSATGATLFVEPFELVERNNACSEAEAAWFQTVLAVLRELTRMIAAEAHSIQQAKTVLEALDLWYCRARYSQLHDCFPAESGAVINIQQARHPLLGKKAIPIDIRFSEDTRLMVISGPNTGGKTVALKTVGLLTLMNQAGIDVPAQMGTCLPVFQSIFADIGDEQSISASLSTFSGHIGRISSFIDCLDGNSLVLLDELGSGTDPEEGGALAIAITEELLESGCTTLITSHHGALKALAYGTPGASNASMEFSQEQHVPTYRVIAGIPGQSHALDIAHRVGLRSRILERAATFLESRETPLEDLVEKLGQQYQELRDTSQVLAEQERAFAERETAFLNREAVLREKEQDLQKAQLAQSSGFLRDARSAVEASIRELDSLRASVDEEKNREIAEAARTSRNLVAALSAEQKQEEARLSSLMLRNPASSDLREGATVWLLSTNQQGVLEREVRPGLWLVSVHNKKIEFRADQIQISDNPPRPKKLKPHKPNYILEGYQVAAYVLDVRGQRLSEIRDSIVRQIDTALMQGMDCFSVIHGKGEGVLQKAIHEYLKDCPGVEKFEFARPEDGGSGKTLIFLRH